MITCSYRNSSSILPLQVQDTLFSVRIFYVTFINYIIILKVPFYWTFCFFSAILIWCLVTWFRCYFFIMSLNDFWHIVHPTVSDFSCIAVENFVKFAACWRMFCYQLKQCVCNVCWNGFAKGWVKSFALEFFGFSDLLLAYFKSILQPDFFSESLY